MSNRTQRQLRKKQKAKFLANLPVELMEFPREKWPPAALKQPTLFKVYMSRNYLVQLYDEGVLPGFWDCVVPNDTVVRMAVNRADCLDGEPWATEISWEELQSIKDLIGYEKHYAIEVYPKARDIVNQTNMRHIWILPRPLSIGWTHDGGAAS